MSMVSVCVQLRFSFVLGCPWIVEKMQAGMCVRSLVLRCKKRFGMRSVPEATTNRVIPRATCEVDTYSFHAFLLCSPLCHMAGSSRLMSLLLASTHTGSGESKTAVNTQFAGAHKNGVQASLNHHMFCVQTSLGQFGPV